MRHVILCFCILFSERAVAVRLKDIAQLRGARDNQLVGYGIVVGLAGTGDKSLELTEGSLSNVLKGLGADVRTQKLDTRNAAAVVASAVLPPFSRVGTRIDVQISSVGTSVSLEGGTLMMTALKGADGTVYAIAQGSVVTQKKADAQGRSLNANLASAVLPGGALIEREIAFDFQNQRDIRWVLGNPDFTTAVRIAKKIDEELGGKYANASDAATVDVILPYQFEASPVELIAQIESLDVETDTRAKVVINSRTGTVILGEQVRVSPVAIAHSNLKIEVAEDRSLSADAGMGSDSADAPTAKKTQKIVVMSSGTNIADIVSSLNAMGASSDDLISLMQALKSSGALMAELELR